MTNSNPIFGTNTNKTKMNWCEYHIAHCLGTGWQSFFSAFKMWRDLMTSNYKDYALLDDDDPEEECKNWFWFTLTEDEVYSKEFLEGLLQMVEDVQSGKMKTYAWDDLDELLNVED